jgi:DNA-binding NtrC family response regulator
MTYGKRILIVDDDPSCLDVSSELLRAAGHEVETAPEWTEVTQILFRGDRPVDLVLLDVTMPAFSGDRIAPILSRYVKDTTPVVLYSGLPEERLAKVCEDCGASGFLQKGRVSGLKLVEAVKRWLPSGQQDATPGLAGA